jgi:hypothetical protein
VENSGSTDFYWRIKERRNRNLGRSDYRDKRADNPERLADLFRRGLCLIAERWPFGKWILSTVFAEIYRFGEPERQTAAFS